MSPSKSIFVSVLAMASLAFAGMASAKTIDVAIGHQSMVTNTVSGGIVLQKLDLISKYLPKHGKGSNTRPTTKFYSEAAILVFANRWVLSNRGY